MKSAAIEESIRSLKEEIVAAKQEKAEGEGALKTYLDLLKNNHKIPTITKAKVKIQKLHEEESQTENDLEKEFTALKANFAW